MVIQMNKVSIPVDNLHHSGIPMGDNTRDPYSINSNIQAEYGHIIGEPESLKSPEWAWKLTTELFKFVQAATYRFLVVILAPILVFIAAVTFGILHFLQIWCVRPILKFMHVIFSASRSFVELVLNGTISPLIEVFGLICSKMKIRHQRVYDVKDEPPFPFII